MQVRRVTRGFSFTILHLITMTQTTSNASTANHLPLSVADLLALDPAQTVRFLQAHVCDDGSIDISSVPGCRDLSGAEKGKLAEKLMFATAYP